jgi:hypothetical protein
VTTTVVVLGAVCAHLAQGELPAIASVYVAASVPPPQVTVQLACHDPRGIAQGLLAWANTLKGATAEVWRVPGGDSVHLSVTGLLVHAGATIQVYASTPATDCGLGADLAPDTTTTIPIPTLRSLAALGEVIL